ncbi:AI-2E family transporter [bacterium]|nr:AI-2E family transporter [bacterium]
MALLTEPVLKPSVRRTILLILALAAVAIFGIIFPLISDLLVTLIICLVLAYIIRPLMVMMERLGVQREVSILGIFALAIGLLIFALQYFIPFLANEIGSLLTRLEQVNINAFQAKMTAWLDERFPSITTLFGFDGSEAEEWLTRVRGATSGFLEQSLTILASAANVLALSIVVPFITFFILRDGDKLHKNFIARVPNRFFEMAVSLSNRIDEQLGNYIRSVLLESLIVGVLVSVMFAIVGVKFSLVLGIVNGLLNMIPFFGPLISWLPTGLVILITYDQVGFGMFWMAITLISVQSLDNVILKPWLISKSVNVHPAAVLLAVLIGGRIAGPIGMFVAVPVYSVLKVIIVDFYSHLKAYRII